MNWELFISWRYLMARRRERFISAISLISIIGIALGVMALIVVISVMNGADKELCDRIVGVSPHILVGRQGGMANQQELLTVLDKGKYVKGASPFINGEVLFEAREAITGVLLRGIDPSREGQVTKIEEYLTAGSLDLADTDIIVGKELAKTLYLDLDDEVTVISPKKGKRFKFTVAGIFDAGWHEYDLKLVLTSIEAAQEVFDMRGLVGGIGVRLDNLYQAPVVRSSLQKALGHTYWVRDWMSMNRNLLNALKLEKTALFVIVALVIVVACFSIAGTLIMLVMEKTKDIGILKAIGASNRAIRRIFTFQGLIIGLLGTGLGAAGGILLCHLLKTYKFIKLPAYYFVEKLPVQMRWMDLVVITGTALGISLLAALYPAHQAARLNPADTLRYE